ncbi:MAG TPA: phosphoribosylanthranilate isomerase [Candidatus Binatia bacterium]|nr:phosphoribosylanthranilate isomerase [Candidatus Binatia bacterium]
MVSRGAAVNATGVPWVKFCGITRAQDADAAVELGAAAVGFVFAAGSARFIEAERAAMIRRRLPKAVRAVALFQDADAAAVRRTIAAVEPDVLQFHGGETPQFCAQFRTPWWRAVPMTGLADGLGEWSQRFAGAEALLLDGHAAGQAGGQGRTFDWSCVRGATLPVVLAGGLTPENVAEAVRRVRPSGVDVSSGIESARGIKDREKMQRFIAEVQRGSHG